MGPSHACTNIYNICIYIELYTIRTAFNLDGAELTVQREILQVHRARRRDRDPVSQEFEHETAFQQVNGSIKA